MNAGLRLEGLPRIYVDTTVFVHFGRGGALIPLVSLLGERARIVSEVDREIERNSTKPDHSFLSVLSKIRGWPPVPPIVLTPEQMREVLDIKNAVQQPGDHPLKDLGEIATVIAACADGRAPVASDDGLAAKLCSVREMRRITSTELSAEMERGGVELGSDRSTR